MLKVENNGPLLTSTNYWQTEHARAGMIYVSFNAGAARVLVPGLTPQDVEDMKAAKKVICTRGHWAEQDTDAYEFVFEDNTDSPYAICVATKQTDRLLPATDAGKPLRTLVYNEKGLVLDLPGRFETGRLLR